jgi:signal transduction histidine kinase
MRMRPSLGAASSVLALQRVPLVGSVTRLDPLDRAIVGCVAGLILFSAAMLSGPGIHLRIFSVAGDVALDTVTTVVTLAVATLAWIRYRERAESVALFQAGAFMVLATANGMALVQAARLTEPGLAVALALPGNLQTGLATLARLAAAAMLVVGGVLALRRWTPRRVLQAFLVVTVILVPVGAGVGLMAGVPDAFSGAVELDRSGAADLSRVSAETFVGVAAQLLGSAMFLFAAALSRRLFLRDGATGDSYLAVGLVFAAFAQMLFALDPGAVAGLVSGGDLFRLAFDVVLLLGIEAEVRGTVAALRGANGALRRLGDAEKDHAAQEERSRLSRELHDGLAQALWLAKLKAARLLAMEGMDPEAYMLCEELRDAVDAGLVEARHAVMATRLSGASGAPMPLLMAQYLDDFADRFGIPTEFECDPNLPRLAARAEAEMLRIAQEATNNVRKHADATLLRVRAWVSNGRVSLVVEDNGHGFDTGAVCDDRYGLASMRERAELIGGQFSIQSSPATGTRILVDVPVAAPRTVTRRATA